MHDLQSLSHVATYPVQDGNHTLGASLTDAPPDQHNKRKKETALWQLIPLAVP